MIKELEIRWNQVNPSNETQPYRSLCTTLPEENKKHFEFKTLFNNARDGVVETQK